ncbi:molecular chaperone DnaJ [Enterococcus termitis]|uniref:Molecular chaperone DnaJ n=1 Tax=Enterococcus termitis TaxID=332950 RepID=A0A1E5GJP8_9ENTE|nr:molecular chaperone DnaJ [Enterococcus termitis]OEG12851.1 molecular chaperone DnaJ [Enterococcus termitis]OJG96498.1 DnaJ domain-containing protein [Enterococcus termitis]
MKFIKEVETLEELKREYKRLSLKHHPDCGGDEENMKALNNEYDELFQKLKHIHKNKEGEFYKKETEETPEEWREIISKLLALKMVGVVIEVVGSFLWISGNTKPYKEQLGKNGLGFKWSQNKTAWYLSPKGYKKYSKKSFEMDDIREMYGSQRVKEKKEPKRLLSVV